MSLRALNLPCSRVQTRRREPTTRSKEEAKSYQKTGAAWRIQRKKRQCSRLGVRRISLVQPKLRTAAAHSMPRFSPTDAVEALFDGGEAFVDERFELVVGKDVWPVVFDALPY